MSTHPFNPHIPSDHQPHSPSATWPRRFSRPQPPVPLGMSIRPYQLPTPALEAPPSRASTASGVLPYAPAPTGPAAPATPPVPPAPSARLLGFANPSTGAGSPVVTTPTHLSTGAGLGDFWGAVEDTPVPFEVAAAAPRSPAVAAEVPQSRSVNRSRLGSCAASDGGVAGADDSSAASSSSGEGPVVYASTVHVGDWALVAPLLEEEAVDEAGRRALVMKEGWVKDVVLDEPYQPKGEGLDRVSGQEGGSYCTSCSPVFVGSAASTGLYTACSLQSLSSPALLHAPAFEQAFLSSPLVFHPLPPTTAYPLPALTGHPALASSPSPPSSPLSFQASWCCSKTTP